MSEDKRCIQCGVAKIQIISRLLCKSCYSWLRSQNNLPDSIMRRCKKCFKELKNRNYKAIYCSSKCSPSQSLEKRLKIKVKKYGLTLTQFRNLYQKTKGKCFICDRFYPPMALYIDHNHLTGKIRGLLCVRCNNCLKGHVWDSEQIAMVAWEYIKGGFGA